MNELQQLLASAKNQVGYAETYDATGAVRHVHQKPAASVSRHSLRAMELPAFAVDPLRIIHTPLGTEAGKRTKLSDAVLAGSRVAAAGAHLIIVPTAAEPVAASNGELIFTRQETRFDVIDPAEFAVVPDGDELTATALPVHRTLVDLETMPSLGFRVELSRRDQKAYADGELADTALASIALGLGRAVDATLLSAIAATTPDAFSLGAAAALGIEWSELRALVGTSGSGGLIAPDGTLRAGWGPSTSGVLAELTPDTAATILGAFNRAAVAVSEDIALIAERIDVNGQMALTCWCNMSALLPVPGAFWTVGA